MAEILPTYLPTYKSRNKIYFNIKCSNNINGHNLLFYEKLFYLWVLVLWLSNNTEHSNQLYNGTYRYNWDRKQHKVGEKYTLELWGSQIPKCSKWTSFTRNAIFFFQVYIFFTLFWIPASLITANMDNISNKNFIRG